MRKLLLRTVTTFLVLAGTTFLPATGATADVPDIVINTIEGTLGTNSCTVSASTTTPSGAMIFGNGSVSCDRRAGFMAVIVCTETSANAQPNTWVIVGVCGVNQSSNVFARSATSQTPCEQTPMWYRTRTIGIASTEGGDLTFTGTIYSDFRRHGCL